MSMKAVSQGTGDTYERVQKQDILISWRVGYLWNVCEGFARSHSSNKLEGKALTAIPWEWPGVTVYLASLAVTDDADRDGWMPALRVGGR
jgi:hypothetical protein